MEQQRENKRNSPHDSLQLSKLISQLEILKGDGKIQPLEPSSVSNNDNDEDERRSIIKELKEIKKQNFVTHCLISAMIVLTLTWQLSEMSLLLKMKDGFSHPFRSITTMFKGMLNWDKQKKSTNKEENEGTLISPLKMPEMPNLGFDNDNEK